MNKLIIDEENSKDVSYYECHITVEPLYDEQLEIFKNICKEFNFKVADLVLKKRAIDSTELVNNDIKIWRSKIEAIVYDEKMSKQHREDGS